MIRIVFPWGGMIFLVLAVYFFFWIKFEIEIAVIIKEENHRCGMYLWFLLHFSENGIIF